MKYVKFILLSIIFLALSCAREPELHTVAPRHFTVEQNSVHMRITASGGSQTRATVNGNTQYVFESGDRLFVQETDSGDTLLFGILTMISGAGNTTAVFEGDLYCDEEFDASSSTNIKVTLVSSSDLIHTVKGGKMISTIYPANNSAQSLEEAIRKYSDFTCSSTLASNHFTLSQHSTFILCHVTASSDDMPDNAQVETSLISGTEFLWSGILTASESDATSAITVVITFPGDEIELDSPELTIEWTDGNSVHHDHSFNDLANGTLLAANNYYTVSRTTIVYRYPGFRIIALANGTITASNFTTLEYTQDEGENWHSYSSGISVTTGDEVCFRAGSADATDDGTNHKKIVSNATFKVAGDMASLLTGANFGTPSATIPNNYTFVNFFTNCTQLTDASDLVFSMPRVPGSALKSFFDGCSNLVTGPAELSATRIGSTCYRNMFKGCSSLTSAPIIRKPTTYDGDKWYQQMFRDCSSLQEIVFLDTKAYSSGNFTDWVNGINASGTFYVPDKDNNNPFGNNRGNSAIPSGWTVATYSE